ncbi:MAG TPA: aryl-sulfate sulfotransferase, partial [Ignavibacteria bacterium]|nr:aryl-sulfate sulfotransferase [Ignavibacteria bacterium]HMR40888.1 aryl-sulfate sulfotransferase [Ignavibacteria bacterium]
KNDGSIEYAREINPNVGDFKKQPNGLFAYYSYATGIHYAEDSQFNIVDSFYCGNGYTTDPHDLRLLNNGHALLMSYDPQTVNMAPVVHGGQHNATVTGLIIQEIDQNKNVVFQWRSWDHFDIVDAIYEDLTAPTVDCVHGNAIELDTDGNILISSRHLSEITKINRTTGEIIWRLGGVNNQFTFVNESIPFHYQHDIRRIANGNITLFDNGNFRSPSFSRAVEYNLDEVNKIATLVWQYRNTPDIYGAFMGSVQRLQNGNTLICWGGTNPNVTEVTPAGSIALQMTYPLNTWTYRAFKDQTFCTLSLKIATEGLYNSETDRLNLRDTVTAYIRNSSSPFSIIDSAKSVIDSVSLTGDFIFYNATTGNYYISIKHRNGIETWSRSGGELISQNGVYLYDFTTSGSKAYGNNLTLKGSRYCIYSGDVNQDGVIELSDIISVYNDLSNFVTGYVSTDINGDNITDTEDELTAYNNAINIIGVLSP